MEEEQPQKLPSVFRLVKPAWELLRVNTTVIIGVIATPLLVSFPLLLLLLILSGAATASGHTLSVGTVNAFAVLFVAMYITLVVTLVVVNIATMTVTLKAARGEKLSYTEAFRAAWPYFFRVVRLYVLVSVAVLVGLVLLVVPGLIMLRRYFLAGYYMVDRNLGVFEAMDTSADETKKTGGVWGLLGFSLLIGLSGLIPHIGWIFAVAGLILFTCMTTWRYIQITARLAPVQPKAEPRLVPKLGELVSQEAIDDQSAVSTTPEPTKPKATKKKTTAKPKTKKAAGRARKNRSRR